MLRRVRQVWRTCHNSRPTRVSQVDAGARSPARRRRFCTPPVCSAGRVKGGGAAALTVEVFMRAALRLEALIAVAPQERAGMSMSGDGGAGP